MGVGGELQMDEEPCEALACGWRFAAGSGKAMMMMAEFSTFWFHVV